MKEKHLNFHFLITKKEKSTVKKISKQLNVSEAEVWRQALSYYLFFKIEPEWKEKGKGEK